METSAFMEAAEVEATISVELWFPIGAPPGGRPPESRIVTANPAKPNTTKPKMAYITLFFIMVLLYHSPLFQ